MSVSDENELPSHNPHEPNSDADGSTANGRVSSPQWTVREVSPAEVRAQIECNRRKIVASSFSGPDPIKLDFQDFTFRAIGNRLYWRESHSTYVDFLLDLIKFAFGPKWHKQQVETAEAQRHLVMRWGMTWYRHCLRVQAEQDTGEKRLFCAKPTGDAQSLLTLADDLYRLQLAQNLTSELMRRLRSPEAFQGARYEIQVASIFLRSGFEIEWVSDKGKKHCEFYALHRHSKQRVAVEAKSRKRPGILGQNGQFQLDHPWGLEKLYDDARQQNPGTCPFCVFIDVNWPVQPHLPKWQSRGWARCIGWRKNADQHPTIPRRSLCRPLRITRGTIRGKVSPYLMKRSSHGLCIRLTPSRTSRHATR